MLWSPAKLSCTTSARAGYCSALVIALVPCIVDGCLFSREIKFLKNAWLCRTTLLKVYHRVVTGTSGSCLGLRGTLNFLLMF